MSEDGKNPKYRPMTLRELRDHANEIAEIERQERRAFDEACKTKGLKQERVRAPDGTNPLVWSGSASLRGFDDHQKRAAQRFMVIYERAHAGMKSASLEMKVDGGGPSPAGHAARIEAQQMLSKVREGVGEYHYWMVVSVAYGMSPAAIHQAGGEQHRTVKAAQRAALDELDRFFTGKMQFDRTLTAIKEMTERIERAAREAE